MAAAEPRSFHELYQNRPAVASGDFLAGFAIGTATQPQALRTNLANASPTESKVVVYLTSDTPPRVGYLHRLTRYAPQLGVATAWDGRIFALEDDIGAGNIFSVAEPPNNMFHRTNNINVLTIEALSARLTADPTLASLGPHADGDANVEQIRTRQMMVVPPAYASLIVGNAHMSGPAFWARVILPIIAAGEVADCQALVDWARVAITKSAVDTYALHDADAITRPILDDALKARTWAWVTEDLPVLGHVSAPYLQQMVIGQQQLQQLIQQQNAQHAAAAVAASAPTSVRKAYPQGVQFLLTITGATNEDDLNVRVPFWGMFANAKKSEKATTLDHALVSRALAATGNQVAPQASPAMVQQCLSLKFTTQSREDIMSGVNPFQMATSTGSRRATAERADAYSIMQGGSASPSFEFVGNIIRDAPQMPLNAGGATEQRRGLSTYIDVLLGTAHPLAETFRVYTERMARLDSELDEFILEAGKRPIEVLPSIFRLEQLMLASYFNSMATRGLASATVPDFETQVCGKIELRMFMQFPALPGRYLNQLGAGGAHVASSSPGLAAPTGVSEEPLAEPRRNTRERAAGAGEGGGAPSSVRVANTRSVPTLVNRYASSGKTVRTVFDAAARRAAANGGPVLALVDGGGAQSGRSGQICLNFHLNKECNSNCTRRGSHRPLSSSEEAGVAAVLTAAGVP